MQTHFTTPSAGTQQENAAPPIGHNSKLTKAELELAFRERTRADRIKEHTPFDLKWQWELVLSELPANAKFIGLVIRLYQNASGSGCCPSIDSIVYLTGLTKPTIIANLKLLEKAIFVSIQRGRGRSPSTYNLIIPDGTFAELAEIIDIRSGKTILPQSDPVAVKPFNHELRSGKVDDRSGKMVLPDITRDITTTLEGVRENRTISKAVAIGIGMAASTLPLAAAPAEPPAIVQPAKEISYDELKVRLMEAGGEAMGISAGLEVLAVPRRWLLAGCDLVEDILPALRARSAKMPPRSINSWNYFEQAVADAREARTAPMPQGRSPTAERMAPWEEKELRVYNEGTQAMERLRAKYALEEEQGIG